MASQLRGGILRLSIALVVGGMAVIDSATPQQAGTGLTAVPGIRVGHSTLADRPTGCTVVLAEPAAIGGVDIRGSAPGTRETDLLNPVNLVDRVNGVVLAGGSAFGLDAASGVMRYLDERGIGYDTAGGKVPIVPAAILFDLGVGNPKVRPTADCGYRAAAAATAGPVEEGNIGAGAGATVGKLAGAARAMKGGIGTSSITLPGGLVVAALVAVNAVGTIVDPSTGKAVAGVRTPDGKALADIHEVLRAGEAKPALKGGESTTLAVVATNARLTKTQATKVAQMAADGVARAIVPAHTPYDGDTIFVLATGALNESPDLLVVGALAADSVSDAILRAVKAAKGIEGYPAARDFTNR